MANNNETERRIRERAFQIWIEEGQPEGRDKEHWERAEKELGSAPHNESPPLQPEPIGEIKSATEQAQSQNVPERNRN